MKPTIIYIKLLQYGCRTAQNMLLGMVMVFACSPLLNAQETQYTHPAWWTGAAAGANVNFYRGSTRQLNNTFTSPATFHQGTGVGLYAAPLVEYHFRNSGWGLMLQAGYDSRRSTFDQTITPCNCPADLSANLSYITVEPGVRFAPFQSGFYLFGGPRVAFNLEKNFTYRLGINPAFPLQETSPDVKGDFSNINQVLVSARVGAGYDIPVTSPDRRTQVVISPFVAFQPYFGQSPRTSETWNITTLRGGAALKFGCARARTPYRVPDLPPVADVQFWVVSPENIPVERRVRETFPLRNYIFFDSGSTQIPDRYVLLNKSQVKDFKEDQLEVFSPKRLSGRSARAMTVYYNVLNILGDRMGKNPYTVITLVGSSLKGPEEGWEMAESIKQYLVDVFGISSSRIAVEGLDRPKIPSEQPGSTRDLPMLRAGDRRVSIESNSPELLMEFQSGPDAPLRPLEIVTIQNAPEDSYVSFTVKGAKESLNSWTLDIRDEKNNHAFFGPYSQENIRVPGPFILAKRPEGRFTATMTGQAKNGAVIKKEAAFRMALWTPSQNEEGMRFSVIFEFDDSKTIGMYEKYLTEIVTPKIPKGGTVIIHGHTDIIGEEAYNAKLSTARAEEVKKIILKSLSQAGRTDVIFEVYGWGEDETVSPFENQFPEERFYNRTVIIDIIPHK